MERIVFQVETSKTGFGALAEYGQSLIATVGHDMSELKANAIEATSLALERDVSIDELYFKLDIPSFFKHYRVLNASAVAQRAGMKQSQLAQYINGQKKPGPKTTQRILTALDQLIDELTGLRQLLKA